MTNRVSGWQVLGLAALFFIVVILIDVLKKF